MAERARLEAVVFDAGGTLVRLDYEWISAMLASLGAAATPAALHRAEVEGRRRFDGSFAHPPAGGVPPALGQRGDTQAYFTGMLEAAHVPAGIVTPALERLAARQREHGLWTRPAEGARETIDALLSTPLRLACVSNSDGRAEQTLEACGVRDGLEFVIDSHVVGIEKPDPRIFELALAGLGVPAAHALYVGDIRAVDETGARAAGMHFVLIDPWMDYGDPENGIPAIRELPYWITTHFGLPAPRAGVKET